MCVLLVKWAHGAPVPLQGIAFHLHCVSVIQLVTLWTAAWPKAGRSGFLNWSYCLLIITLLFVSHETLGLCPSATQVSRTPYAFLFHTLAVVLHYTSHQWKSVNERERMATAHAETPPPAWSYRRLLSWSSSSFNDITQKSEQQSAFLWLVF